MKSLRFKGLSVVTEGQRLPEIDFPCILADYGSLFPRARKAIFPSRSHAINQCLGRAYKTTWLVFFSPNVKIDSSKLQFLNFYLMLWSKGCYGSGLVDPSSSSYAFIIRTFYFPPFDCSLSDSDSLVYWLESIKKLPSKEIEPFWKLI